MRTEKQKHLLYRMSLITLISTVELFISDLLHFHFDRNPGAVGTDFQISMEDLEAQGSISFEEARQRLIGSKIERELRGGPEKWIDLLRPHVSIEDVTLTMDMLIEVYQRRNLMVHNFGRVDSTYLKKVKQHLRENYGRGDVLDVPPEYLGKAIHLYEPDFILIAAQWWKKLAAKDEERPTTLERLAETHMQNERWEVAERLSKFMVQDKGVSERSRTEGLLNFWLSVKSRGRFEEIRKEVEKADFSAK